MVDGRHTGTGGGNHIVLGGATPADSPLLRRPDLLRSLVAYWHNHPSLSYLFSGLFIGPTSQHPRVDEARDDQLHELEIAMAQIDRLDDAAGRSPARPAVARRPDLPQHADRRHRQHAPRRVLHRQALRARQRQRPAGPARAARLRDAAARAHEPGAAAAAAGADRALLGRAVSARAGALGHRAARSVHAAALRRRRLRRRARRPERGRLRLRRRRGSRRTSSSASRTSARSPTAASTSSCATPSSRGTCSARRRTGGGTARYVDSSLERLQVKVHGLIDGRHVVACNGRAVPLHPTGTHGEYVAGVRYRAWQPPSALHPTIAVHAPLVFDVVDTWTGRSIGGCTLPRRASGRAQPRHAAGQRLRGRGPPAGPLPRPWATRRARSTPARAVRNPDFPFTLDLRRS